MSHDHFSEFSARGHGPYEIACRQMASHVDEIAEELADPLYFSDLMSRQLRKPEPADTFSATWDTLDRIIPRPPVNIAGSRTTGILFGIAITEKTLGETKAWDKDVANQAVTLREMAEKLPYHQQTDDTLLVPFRLLNLCQAGIDIAQPYISVLANIASYPPKAVYDPYTTESSPEFDEQEFLRGLGLTIYQSTQVLKTRHAT